MFSTPVRAISLGFSTSTSAFLGYRSAWIEAGGDELPMNFQQDDGQERKKLAGLGLLSRLAAAPPHHPVSVSPTRTKLADRAGTSL